jgi:hypothetical protein
MRRVSAALVVLAMVAAMPGADDAAGDPIEPRHSAVVNAAVPGQSQDITTKRLRSSRLPADICPNVSDSVPRQLRRGRTPAAPGERAGAIRVMRGQRGFDLDDIDRDDGRDGVQAVLCGRGRTQSTDAFVRIAGESTPLLLPVQQVTGMRGDTARIQSVRFRGNTIRAAWTEVAPNGRRVPVRATFRKQGNRFCASRVVAPGLTGMRPITCSNPQAPNPPPSNNPSPRPTPTPRPPTGTSQITANYIELANFTATDAHLRLANNFCVAARWSYTTATNPTPSGVVQTADFPSANGCQSVHEFLPTNLTPTTTYRVSLTLVDRFGNTEVITSNFTTRRPIGSPPPPPPSSPPVFPEIRTVALNPTTAHFTFDIDPCVSATWRHVARDNPADAPDPVTSLGYPAVWNPDCWSGNNYRPGVWTPALRPGVTYDVTVTISNGAGFATRTFSFTTPTS